MVSVDGNSTTQCATSAILCFNYNAFGARVRKNISQGSDSRYYYYDAFGSVAFIRSQTTILEDFMPMVAGRNYVKYQDGVTYYLHTNALGTTASVTNQANAVIQDVLYYPWGQQWTQMGTMKDQRFASMQERDSETVSWQDPLDPTPFRMYTSNLGRWLSPDPLAGSISNPQSLNRYAYVGNNPTTFIDPLGLQGGGPPPGVFPCLTSSCAHEHWNWGPYPGFESSEGAYECVVDGIEGKCGELKNALHGSTTLFFQAQVGQAILNSTVIHGALNSGPRWAADWTLYGEDGSVYAITFVHAGYTTMNESLSDSAWCSSNACLGFLSATGNFASGAADVLTFGGTYLVQRAQGTNSVVNRNGGTYYAGVATGAAMQAAFAATGAALADGKNGALFGRGLSTLFNSSYIRFGWYWAGPAIGGIDVIGLRIGPPRTGFHIPFLYP